MDKEILTILAHDCRTPYREIAKKLEISANAVKKRIDHLIEREIISDFIVEFNPAMIGSEMAFIWLTTDGTESKSNFITEIGHHQAISQVAPVFGGGYLLFGEYENSMALTDLSDFLRNRESVSNVEIHAIATPSGTKVDLTRLQIRVLKALLSDARMQIKDIARLTGITVRIVRRTLNELKEGGGIRFSLRWRLSAGDRVAFHPRIEWSEKEISRQDFLDWLIREYQEELWVGMMAATRPMFIGSAIVDTISEVESVIQEIERQSFIKNAIAYIYQPARNFKSLRRLRLEQLVANSDV
ncbi:MAG: winged helix-turn-helix transcriptional regulator [Candidatus Lokiarchaeota archaeon]|nr:winged helix-turn-helix transcriptional regulator [Candidatus Lokiarchaeota archaeon]